MSNINKIEGYLRDHGAAERVISIFKAAASFHPVSSSIASLISDYIPNQRQLRLEEFANSVADELSRVKDEVNDDYIKTKEFAFIFEKCFKGAVENYQFEKIQAFKAVIINSLRQSDLTQNEREFYLSLIDRLSVTHVRVLFFLYEPHHYLDTRSIPRTNVEGSFSQFIPRVMPDVKLDFVKLVFHDLFGYGFIDTDKSIFNTMTATSGYDLLGQRVTKTGKAFIDFISL